MGFGWIFTSDLSMNIKYSGSCKEWASSTKAELVAIITALIVCPPHSTINIYTDSNNCINTFNDLHSPKLTARRFQKLNNLKAHSDNPLNDAADILAKEDWEYSQLWFKYNSFSKPTSKQYTKHISWRVKCSSHNLPTLDILNRNYPELLQNYETCILCSTYI
ncbi:ribonuclease H-like domain-containing protein [Rhizophagus irregularis DAOM 181602=DAOM 197198]|nr:ribonuclease H-like domain-containing protein [Rhizophagus irregularis DAOM 181602=DAOM 197198]